MVDNDIFSEFGGKAISKEEPPKDIFSEFGGKSVDVPEKKNSDSLDYTVGVKAPSTEKSDSEAPFISRIDQIKNEAQAQRDLNTSEIIKKKMTEDLTSHPTKVFKDKYIESLSNAGYNKEQLKSFADYVVDTRTNDEKAQDVLKTDVNAATEIGSAESLAKGAKDLVFNYAKNTAKTYSEANKQFNEALQEVPQKIKEIGTDKPISEIDFSHPILKAALNLTTAVASPVIAAFNMGTDAIQKTADKLLPESSAKVVGNAVPKIFSLAHKAAASVGYNPEKDSNGDMLLSFVDFILGGKVMEVGGQRIKNAAEFKNVTEKASKGELTPEEQKQYEKGIEDIKSTTLNDISNGAKQNGADAVADKINELTPTPIEKAKHESAQMKDDLEKAKKEGDPEKIKALTELNAPKIEALDQQIDHARLHETGTILNNAFSEGLASHNDSQISFLEDMKKGQSKATQNNIDDKIESLKQQIPNEDNIKSATGVVGNTETQTGPSVTNSTNPSGDIEPTSSENVTKSNVPEQATEKEKDSSVPVPEGIDTGKPEQLLTSPVARGKESADLIGKQLGLTPKTHKGLSAWGIGEYDGTPRDKFHEAEKWFIDNPDAKDLPPVGSEESKANNLEDVPRHTLKESFGDFKDRVVKTDNELKADPKYKNSVAVVHSKNIKILRALKDNGGEWNNKAKEQFLNDKVESAEVEPKGENGIQYIHHGEDSRDAAERVGGTVSTKLTGEGKADVKGAAKELGVNDEGNKKIKITHDAIEKSRKELGLPPIEKEASDAKKDFEDAHEDYKDTHKQLAEKLIEKQRPATRKEVYILALGKIDLIRNSERLIKKIAESTGEKRDELKAELAQNDIDKDNNDRALKNVASEAGKALQAMQVALDKDNTKESVLSNMASYSKDGKVPEEQKKLIEDLFKERDAEKAKREELEKKVSDIEDKVSKLEEKLKEKPSSIKRKSRFELTEAEKAEKAKLKSELMGRLNDVTSMLHLVADKDFYRYSKLLFKEAAGDFENFAKDIGESFTKIAKEDIPKLWDKLNGESSVESKLEKNIERTEKRIGKKTEALESGDVKKILPKPKSLELDLKTKEAKELKAKLDEQKVKEQRVNKKINQAREEYRLSQRGRTERTVDMINDITREMGISGLSGMGKIFESGVANQLFKGVENAVGALTSNLMPDVKSKATIEGKFNPSIELKSLGKYFDKRSWQDAWDKFKTGQHREDVLHGDEKHPEHTIKFKLGDKNVEFNPFVFGRAHAFLKTPTYKVAYERALQYLSADAIKNPDNFGDNGKLKQSVIDNIEKDAFEEGKRDVYLQPNKVAQAVRGGIHKLENGKSVMTRALGKLLKFQVQVLNVGLNYFAKQTSYVPGYAHVKALLNAPKGERSYFDMKMQKAMKELTPNQANYILRNMKTGNVGVGLFALGVALPNIFGGYNSDKSRDSEDELGQGDIKLAGYQMPHWATHIPIFYVMQLGATLRRYMDSEDENKSASKTSLDALKSTIKLNPFNYGATSIMDATSNTDKANQFLFNQTVGRFEPQLLNEIATGQDKGEDGKPVKRNPQSWWDMAKMKIPGARQTVDEK